MKLINLFFRGDFELVLVGGTLDLGRGIVDIRSLVESAHLDLLPRRSPIRLTNFV